MPDKKHRIPIGDFDYKKIDKLLDRIKRAIERGTLRYVPSEHELSKIEAGHFGDIVIQNPETEKIYYISSHNPDYGHNETYGLGIGFGAVGEVSFKITKKGSPKWTRYAHEISIENDSHGNRFFRTWGRNKVLNFEVKNFKFV